MEVEVEFFKELVLDEMRCLKPVKRKHVSLIKARLIYRLEDTNFFLVYVTPRHNYYKAEISGGWSWREAKIDRFGNILSLEKTSFEEVVEDSNLPMEIFFNLSDLLKIK